MSCVPANWHNQRGPITSTHVSQIDRGSACPGAARRRHRCSSRYLQCLLLLIGFALHKQAGSNPDPDLNQEYNATCQLPRRRRWRPCYCRRR
jgi:hypothetical protein